MKNLFHSLTSAAATLGISAAIAFAGFGYPPASAALITIPSTTLPGAGNNESDCSGYFGQGFANCIITGPTGTEFSPVIAKFNSPSGPLEINSALYETIDGSEFTFNPTSGNFPDDTFTGTWTYTPGEGDPAIKYWVAKGGNQGFNLFFNIPDTAEAAAACATPYSDDCLELAQVTTSGTWQTPLNSNGSQPGLSHITFYNSMNGGGGGFEIPEPGAIPGLLAVGGLGLIIRFKKKL